MPNICPGWGLQVSHARLGWGPASAAYFRLCSQIGPAKRLMCLFFWEPEHIPGKGPGEREGVGGKWLESPGLRSAALLGKGPPPSPPPHLQRWPLHPGVGEGAAAGSGDPLCG